MDDNTTVDPVVTKEEEPGDDVDVQFAPHDPKNPFNWPVKRKWIVTLVSCYATLIVGINSTSITAVAKEVISEFNISDESFPNSFWPVTSWNTGAAIAPMILLPLMEKYGTRKGYLISYFLFTAFVIPQATAPNFATLIVTRFIAGCCAGVIQDAMDGIIADIWPTAQQRSLPVTCYVFCLLFGVTLGPVFGGAIGGSLDWRWISYIQLIICGVSAPLIFFAFQETRGPVILAKQINKSKATSQEAYAGTTTRASSLKGILWDTIGLPTFLLCTEPVVFFFTLLSALSYGVVFVSTQSVTQVYSSLYDWNEYQAGLVQSSLLIGEVFGFLVCLLQNTIYSRCPQEPGSTTPIPEARLYMSIPGSFLGLTAGLFWYGWTSYSFLQWTLPSVGLAFVGFGSMIVMQAIMMYVTDAYAKYAASASAAVCFGENIFAAFLPLATMHMYTELGFQWASSFLAFIALALSFAPVVLLFKGEVVRRRSPFMVEAAHN